LDHRRVIEVSLLPKLVFLLGKLDLGYGWLWGWPKSRVLEFFVVLLDWVFPLAMPEVLGVKVGWNAD
jgi:hypothetical protein